MWRDGMQGKGGLSRSQQRITSIFRFTASVGGDAAELHIEFGGGHKVIAAANDGAGRDAGTDMNGGEVVHVIKYARRHHGASAAGTFFCRLENQLNRPVELRGIFLEHVRQPQADCGMTVVAAGMHHAFVAGGKTIAMRTMIIVVLLVEIERIHIDAKRQSRPGPPGVERRYHPGEAAFKRR